MNDQRDTPDDSLDARIAAAQELVRRYIPAERGLAVELLAERRQESEVERRVDGES